MSWPGLAVRTSLRSPVPRPPTSFFAAKTWMPGTRPGMTWIRVSVRTSGNRCGVRPSIDDDLADHAVLGVGLAVLVLDAGLQVDDAAGRDRHEPPFRAVARIDLDLADRALELGERGGLAVARLH